MGKNISKLDGILETDRISDTRIEIFGQKRIVVEGCFGIREFSEDVVQVNLPKGNVIIMGNNLEIAILSGHNITIDGKIFSMQFEGNDI